MLLTLLVGFAAPTVGSAQASEAGVDAPEVPGSQATPPRPQASPDADAGKPRRGLRVWWNHPRLKGFHLTEEQQASLQQQTEAYSSRRAAVQKRLADLHNRIGLAVRSGNLAAARKMSEKLAEFPNPVVEDGLFRLAVLEILTAEQLSYLAENFPVLLSEQWRGGGWQLVRAATHSRRGPHSHNN